MRPPRPRSRPTILITGFGPFPGQARNASSLLADAIAEAAPARVPGFIVCAATLPTEWDAGPARLAGLLDEHHPVVALHFGVSSRAKGFVVETRARNHVSGTVDACGATPAADCVAEDGPDALVSTFPSRQIVDRLRRLRLPAQISRDAGAYLCNSVLYHSLAHARRRAEAGATARHGFIHIPDRLVAGARGGGSRSAVVSQLDWTGAVAGGLAIVAVCAGVGER